MIEYSMRNIFLEKSYARCGGETSPISFLKKIKIEHISGSKVFLFNKIIKIFTARSYCVSKLRTAKMYWN